MDFIKRHYEKLILVLMLFIFIITMLLVISRVDAVKNARYEVNRRNWKKLETKLSGKEKQFDTESLWKASCENWKVSKYRTQKDKNHKNGMENVIFSDLVAYTPLAFCPHCKGSQVLIPLHFFSGKKCPECGNELLTPPARPKFRRRVITADDKDGDGIPDKSERDYNLDPENPNDAMQDSDGDGFTNIFEHENNTNPRNARNCPPLWYRLQFVKFDYVVLPVQFKALNTNNTKDKSLWDIQINLKERDRRGREREKTELCNLGSEIILDERTYKIVKIEERRHAKKKVEKKEVVLNKYEKAERRLIFYMLRYSEVIRIYEKKSSNRDVSSNLEHQAQQDERRNDRGNPRRHTQPLCHSRAVRKGTGRTAQAHH
jgi:hypothetical protein